MGWDVDETLHRQGEAEAGDAGASSDDGDVHIVESSPQA